MRVGFLSRFTPSLMAPETLETLFVQREALAQRILGLIRDSALTPSKHHRLLIGPRGMGKTHFISLIYHRVRAMHDLHPRLRIAWLREEEWGVASFLDFLLRIFRALLSEYRDESLANRVELLYKLGASAAERAGGILLKEFVGNKTLLVLMENLDDFFGGLGDEGQKRLRAYLQENPFITILATSQSLFNGVSLQTSPFYGFFRIHHLEELTLDDAIRLLTNIANLEGNRELVSLVLTPMGRARIRAVHHLAGGNHRVYIIFSQFLTPESLNKLVEPLVRTMDDLTPYYQARMAWLSTQQRKIIEFLCDRRHAVAVKEIAKRGFMTHQTASAQLKILRDMGYVHSIIVGRESYYELHEPLMRLCIEVKKHRGEPIRLIVDFLRLWYSRAELQQRLAMLQPDAALERDYVRQALRIAEEETDDPRVIACLKDYDTHLEKDDYVRALQAAEELVAIRGDAWDWLDEGYCLDNLERHDEALTCFNKAVELNPDEAWAWYSRGKVLDSLKRYEKALGSFDRAIELDPNEAGVWLMRGEALDRLGRHDEALRSFDRAIELDPQVMWQLVHRGGVLGELGRYDEALASLDKAIELSPNDAHAWFHRSEALFDLGHYAEALVSYNKTIELDPNNTMAWDYRGDTLAALGRFEEALGSFDKAILIDPNDLLALQKRGKTLLELGRMNEAIASFDKAIQLDPNHAWVWCVRGEVLGHLGCYSDGISSFEKAIELGEQSLCPFFYRAEFLLGMGRWDEGKAAVNDALNRFAEDDEHVAKHAGGIVCALLASTHPRSTWEPRIRALIKLYDKYGVISALGPGLVESISALRSPKISEATARKWRDMWWKLVGDRAEFQLPFRLLDAAVRYLDTNDPRIFLELPVEERGIVKPLLGVEEPSES